MKGGGRKEERGEREGGKGLGALSPSSGFIFLFFFFFSFSNCKIKFLEEAVALFFRRRKTNQKILHSKSRNTNIRLPGCKIRRQRNKTDKKLQRNEVGYTSEEGRENKNVKKKKNEKTRKMNSKKVRKNQEPKEK